MKHDAKILPIAIIALWASCSVSALALSPRTWVASTGTDSGTCTRAAPCQTFQFAHDQTSAGGSVNVVDSGNYGPITINKSITISAYHVHAGVIGTTTAVTINAADTDSVVLEGLEIDGQNVASLGVNTVRAAAVYVIDCTIKNFTVDGVSFNPSTASARLFLQRSNILKNTTGLHVIGSGHVLSATDSLVDGSAQNGAKAENNAIIGMARTIINASPTSILVTNGALAVSIGPSNIISGAGGFSFSTPFN